MKPVKEVIPISEGMIIAQVLTAKLYNILIAKGILSVKEAEAEYKKDRKRFKSWI